VKSMLAGNWNECARGIICVLIAAIPNLGNPTITRNTKCVREKKRHRLARGSHFETCRSSCANVATQPA
jgi:hypothetical protein